MSEIVIAFLVGIFFGGNLMCGVFLVMILVRKWPWTDDLRKEK